MTETSPSNYYMPFYSGPVTDGKGNPTAGFTRYQLALFNRTGKEPGTDATYNTEQIEEALTTAKEAETDAKAALSSASAAITQATQAETDARSALLVASQAELDAQSALKAAEDVLIITLLTSSSFTAKTAQSLDDAALMAAQSQTWPSQLLQSSQA